MKYSSKHFVITERFWNGKTKVDGKDKAYIFDEEGKKEAIRRATVDLMARTLTPTGVEGKFSDSASWKNGSQRRVLSPRKCSISGTQMPVMLC